MNRSIRMLRLHDVMQKTGLSRSQIYRLIGLCDFPKQIQLGKRSAGWIEDEVDNWLRQCIERSRKHEGYA